MALLECLPANVQQKFNINISTSLIFKRCNTATQKQENVYAIFSNMDKEQNTSQLFQKYFDQVSCDDFRCEQCQGLGCFKQSSIVTSSDIILLRVVRNGLEAWKRNITPNDSLLVDEKLYRLKAVQTFIPHASSLSTNDGIEISQGHYITHLHRNTHCIKCDDTHISVVKGSPKKRGCVLLRSGKRR